MATICRYSFLSHSNLDHISNSSANDKKSLSAYQKRSTYRQILWFVETFSLNLIPIQALYDWLRAFSWFLLGGFVKFIRWFNIYTLVSMKYCNAFITRWFHNVIYRGEKSHINAFLLMPQLTIEINQTVRVFKTVKYVWMRESHKCKQREYFCWVVWLGFQMLNDWSAMKHAKLCAPSQFPCDEDLIEPHRITRIVESLTVNWWDGFCC